MNFYNDQAASTQCVRRQNLDLVQIVADWLLSYGATDEVAHQVRVLVANNAEKIRPKFPEADFGNRVSVCCFRKQAPNAFGRSARRKRDFVPVFGAQGIQSLAKFRECPDGDATRKRSRFWLATRDYRWHRKLERDQQTGKFIGWHPYLSIINYDEELLFFARLSTRPAARLRRQIELPSDWPKQAMRIVPLDRTRYVLTVVAARFRQLKPATKRLCDYVFVSKSSRRAVTVAIDALADRIVDTHSLHARQRWWYDLGVNHCWRYRQRRQLQSRRSRTASRRGNSPHDEYPTATSPRYSHSTKRKTSCLSSGASEVQSQGLGRDFFGLSIVRTAVSKPHFRSVQSR